MTPALSRLRVLETDERRDIERIYSPDGHLVSLSPVRGSDRYTIKVGTEADAVTLNLSQPDFYTLMQLVDRLGAAGADS